jgi:hypothetical protein
MIISDIPRCGITDDHHSVDSRGVIFDNSMFAVQVTVHFLKLGLKPNSFDLIGGLLTVKPGNTKGLNHCTVVLQFVWFGISCMTTDNFRFYLQNRPIQTSQTGGQWYIDTSPFSIPWLSLF